MSGGYTPDVLARMAHSPTYKIFISHAWDYSGDYEGIVNLLNSDSRFRWQDLSIQKENALSGPNHLPRSNRWLVHEIDRRISQSDCLLVLDAMYLHHREWIQSEIEAAEADCKPIIAIAPRGQQRLPAALAYASERVRWNASSIVEAIRRWVPAVAIPGINPRMWLR